MTGTPPVKTHPSIIRVNAVAGSLVAAVGFWLMWGELPAIAIALLAVAVAVFLAWAGRSIARVWAWATLLLGLESLSWPVVTMVRIRLQTTEPTDQQMGDILTSLLFGLFSAVFWTSFAYGIFNWARRQESGAGGSAPGGPQPSHKGNKPPSGR